MKQLDNYIDQINPSLTSVCNVYNNVYIQHNYWKQLWSVFWINDTDIVQQVICVGGEAAQGFVMALCFVQWFRQGTWNVLSVNGDQWLSSLRQKVPMTTSISQQNELMSGPHMVIHSYTLSGDVAKCYESEMTSF